MHGPGLGFHAPQFAKSLYRLESSGDELKPLASERLLGGGRWFGAPEAATGQKQAGGQTAQKRSNSWVPRLSRLWRTRQVLWPLPRSGRTRRLRRFPALEAAPGWWPWFPP